MEADWVRANNSERLSGRAMKSDPELLLFPVLCLPRALGVFTAKNLSELTRCQSVLFWKNKLYEELKIIDASGRGYVVTKTTVRKPRSALGRWFARLLDLPVRLSLELEDRGAASLHEIKTAVSASIDEDPEAFEECSGRSVEWWGLVLGGSVDIMDVLNALNEPAQD